MVLSSIPFAVTYRIQIHSETHTWHDNNIQSNAPKIGIPKTAQSFGRLAKWLVFAYKLSGCGFESCSYLHIYSRSNTDPSHAIYS